MNSDSANSQMNKEYSFLPFAMDFCIASIHAAYFAFFLLVLIT